jgi:hypothetical protein
MIFTALSESRVALDFKVFAAAVFPLFSCSDAKNFLFSDSCIRILESSLEISDTLLGVFDFEPAGIPFGKNCEPPLGFSATMLRTPVDLSFFGAGLYGPIGLDFLPDGVFVFFAIIYFFGFFAVNLDLMKSFNLGAPLLPGFLIFSPDPSAIRLRLAWMFAYKPAFAIIPVLLMV